MHIVVLVLLDLLSLRNTLLQRILLATQVFLGGLVLLHLSTYGRMLLLAEELQVVLHLLGLCPLSLSHLFV